MDYDVNVRDWLSEKFGNDAIGWDNETKTILLNNKPFMTLQDKLFDIIEGHSYSNEGFLNNALRDFFAKTQSPEVEQPGWMTAPSGEPGAGPGTEDLTTAMSGEPIAEAFSSGVLQPAGTEVGGEATNTEVEQMSDFELNEIILSETLKGKIKGFTDILNTLSGTSPLIRKANEIWDAKLAAALGSLEVMFNTMKTALENQKGAVKAQHAGEMEALDKAIIAARKRSSEDMNARGLYFSGLLTTALNTVEEAGLVVKAKALAMESAAMDAIAANIATLTANYAIEKNSAINTVIAEKALVEYAIMEKDQDKRDQINLAIMALQNQLDVLGITEEARGEIYNRAAENARIAAEREEEDRQIKNRKTLAEIFAVFDASDQDWYKIDEQKIQFNKNFDLELDKLGLNEAKFLQAAYEFGETLKLNRDKFNFDKWYKSNLLALKNYENEHGPGSATGGVSGLNDLYSMGATQLTSYIGKLQSMKSPVEVKNGVEVPIDSRERLGEDLSQYMQFPNAVEGQRETLENMERIATMLLGIYQDTNLSSSVDFSSFISKIQVLGGFVEEADANLIIDNYIEDPSGKVIAEIMFAAKGDWEVAKQILIEEKENLLQRMRDYGIKNPETFFNNIETILYYKAREGG